MAHTHTIYSLKAGVLLKQLSGGIPWAYVALAADLAAMDAMAVQISTTVTTVSEREDIASAQDSQREADKELVRAAVEAVRGKVLYLGSAGGLLTKRNLAVMLREAAKTRPGLVILGHGWGR